VDPRVDLDNVEKRKLLILPELSRSSSPYPVAVPTTLSRLHSEGYGIKIYERPQVGAYDVYFPSGSYIM
jgi:hypothetical protein